MKLLKSKKGQMFDFRSFIKGFLLGIIIGAVTIYLMYKGIIPIALP